jgi:hypothetical protein
MHVNTSFFVRASVLVATSLTNLASVLTPLPYKNHYSCTIKIEKMVVHNRWKNCTVQLKTRIELHISSRKVQLI